MKSLAEMNLKKIIEDLNCYIAEGKGIDFCFDKCLCRPFECSIINDRIIAYTIIHLLEKENGE